MYKKKKFGGLLRTGTAGPENNIKKLHSVMRENVREDFYYGEKLLYCHR